MQRAEAVLDALHSLGKRNIPARRVYRLLFNPQLYPDPEDPRLPELIGELRAQRFRWGRDRDRDDAVHFALARILAAHAGGRDCSWTHGLRPGTGIHSALRIARKLAHHASWIGVWSLSSSAPRPANLTGLLEEHVEDRRFQDLLFHFLQRHPEPESGPAELLSHSWPRCELHSVLRHKSLQQMDTHISMLRRTTRGRLRTVRFMNLLLAAAEGSVQEVEDWGRQITALAAGVSDCKIHRWSGMQAVMNSKAPVSFLGHEIGFDGQGKAILRMPRGKAAEISRPYLARGKPTSRSERVRLSDEAICQMYSWEFDAVDQFYALAENRGLLRSVQDAMRASMWRTLAHKHRSSAQSMASTARLRRAGSRLCQRPAPTQYQVEWIDDVILADPQSSSVGEPCAVKVARTVRREARSESKAGATPPRAHPTRCRAETTSAISM